MRMVRTLPLALVALLLSLTSCGPRETLVYESGPIHLTAEGPLYEGSNTAQGSWEPQLEAFLRQQGSGLDRLREARVVRAQLSSTEGTGLQGIRSVSLMLASDAHDMEQVAVLNPLPPQQQQADLVTANEQKGLAGHLKQHAVTVVADLDLDEDSDHDRHVIGSFTIELTIAP
jgi:hypothetical protein